MKIRSGFVSNSSSSSFTLFVKKAAFDKAIAQMSGPSLDAVHDCASGEQAVGNDTFVVVHEHSDMGGEGTLTWRVGEHDYDDEQQEEYFEGLYTLKGILQKSFPGTFLLHST
jgi:hypothetical protein